MIQIPAFPISQADLPPDILALPVSERLELVAKIWDSTADDTIGLSEEHRRILEQRLVEHRENPQAGVCWEDLKKDLRESR